MDKSKTFKFRTTEELTQKVGVLGRIDTTVFVIAAIFSFALVIWGFFDTEGLMVVANAGMSALLKRWGWLYMLACFFFVVFCTALAFSKYGKIKLGNPEDVPEYSTASWISMVFGCGVGVGLVYWSVGEPLYHYYAGPGYAGAQGGAQAAEWSLAVAFLHWGITPWCIYLVCGLAMGLIMYRKNLPALMSTCLYPVLGDKIYGPIGKAIDIFSIVAIVFGGATTVGLGTLQFNSGLNYYFGLPNTPVWNVICLSLVVAVYLASACLPIDRGIKIGSNASLIACLGLMLWIMILGPSTFILNNFVNSLGVYFQNFITMNLFTDPISDTGWLNGWTIFYWAWWTSWAPAVGMFIAKISKGRTIKEFYLCAIIAPTLLCFVYLCVYGSTALHFEMLEETKNLIWGAVQQDAPMGLYVLLDQFPGGLIMGIINLFVIFTFFTISADALTIVMAMLSNGGDPDPKTSVKLVWGLTMGGATAVLMLAGGLGPMQTASILSAFPLLFILLGMCYAIAKVVKDEIVYYEIPNGVYARDMAQILPVKEEQA